MSSLHAVLTVLVSSLPSLVIAVVLSSSVVRSVTSLSIGSIRSIHSGIDLRADQVSVDGGSSGSGSHGLSTGNVLHLS